MTNNNIVYERIEAHMELPNDIVKFEKLFRKAGKKLYVVGGAVRDYLMGKTPHDYDLVTDADPEEVMEILKDYKTDLQGVKFGVVRVFTQDEPTGYEIASYRKDISKGRNTKGSDKKVEVGRHVTIKDDVRRRDLTMNALFYNIRNGEIVDIVNGKRDIDKNIIRSVGDPSKRFNEDRLRILRAIRFAAITGGKIDDDTDKAIREDNRLFGISEEDDVSRERIFQEFEKVKEKARDYNDPEIIKRFVDMLIDYGIMEQIFPVLTKQRRIKPTLYLTVAIAQVLRQNTVDEEFERTLVDAKIPSRFVGIISFLIKLWQKGKVEPDEVYALYREANSKGVRKDILEEWVKATNMTNRSVLKFIDYAPSTSGEEVMSKGIKGAAIGEEIRRIEAEKFREKLSESVIVSFKEFVDKL